MAISHGMFASCYTAAAQFDKGYTLPGERFRHGIWWEATTMLKNIVTPRWREPLMTRQGLHEALLRDGWVPVAHENDRIPDLPDHSAYLMAALVHPTSRGHPRDGHFAYNLNGWRDQYGQHENKPYTSEPFRWQDLVRPDYGESWEFVGFYKAQRDGSLWRQWENNRR